MVVPASVSSLGQASLRSGADPAICTSSGATALVCSITWFLSCVASFKLCAGINNRVVMLASQAMASLNRSAYVVVVRFSGSLSNKRLKYVSQRCCATGLAPLRFASRLAGR